MATDYKSQMDDYLKSGGKASDQYYKDLETQRNNKISGMSYSELSKYGLLDESAALHPDQSIPSASSIIPGYGTNTQNYSQGIQTPNLASDTIAQPAPIVEQPEEDLYAKMLEEYRAEQQKLAEAQRANRISALGKAKDSALSGLDSEKSTVDPYYYDKRNEAAAASDIGAKNFAEYMAGRGITGSSGAMPEMYRNATLQGQIGKLNQQQAAEHSDIERRKSGINSSYESDVASANADIDAQTMQSYIDTMKTVQAQRIADNAAKGLTSTGEQTLTGKTAQNSDYERQAALIAQANYDNIQAEIDRRSAIDPNDPLIPYLQAARQQKIQEQEAAQASADDTAWNNAMALWKASGVASQEVANIIGVPVGAKTADYDLGSMNAQTSRMNAQTAQTNASKTTETKYSYETDPSFQSDVTDIMSGAFTLQDVIANAAALQQTYGYDGYMELVKLATPKE